MKRILYYTDVLALLSKKEAALDKIQRNLEIFSSNSDKIRVIWHPYEKCEEYMKLNNFELMDQYQKIIEDFKNGSFGEFDETSDLKALADSCDAYYGDYSDAVYYMQESKKPVMIQNIDV